MTGGGDEHTERGAETERLVPAQDARLSTLYFLTAIRLLATLACGGVLLNPADAGAIGVETAVYRLEEGILQVDMVRLLSSAGS